MSQDAEVPSEPGWWWTLSLSSDTVSEYTAVRLRYRKGRLMSWTDVGWFAPTHPVFRWVAPALNPVEVAALVAERDDLATRLARYEQLDEVLEFASDTPRNDETRIEAVLRLHREAAYAGRRLNEMLDEIGPLRQKYAALLEEKVAGTMPDGESR